MERKQESADFLYENGELKGFYKQNGKLTLYTAKEANLEDLKEIYNIAPISPKE